MEEEIYSWSCYYGTPGCTGDGYEWTSAHRYGVGKDERFVLPHHRCNCCWVESLEPKTEYTREEIQKRIDEGDASIIRDFGEYFKSEESSS